MTLILLHTAEVHRATFDALRDRIAPGTGLRHVVRPGWLARAQKDDPTLEADLAGAIGRATGPVICTCTTLGPMAEMLGAIRVDWPMMQAAAALQGPVMLAFCLESAAAPSVALLDRALEAAGTPQKVLPLPLVPYWPLFEAGELDAFAAVIAGEIRQAVAAHPETAGVILAQVSMAGAAPLLADLGVPVLSSPELALRAGLAAQAS
ncbi:hypothetical protein [Roseovarius aestuariivivens]|uniref:hypothetical protein n=1 Tax=Roseovarius aestuariivivens TaxID=1888910 RepID=UPI001AEC4C04|nr:hypothetical protein [Roseovarius aestuariivivens]